MQGAVPTVTKVFPEIRKMDAHFADPTSISALKLPTHSFKDKVMLFPL